MNLMENLVDSEAFMFRNFIPALEELEDAFLTFREDKEFTRELSQLLKDFAGRPTALYHAQRSQQRWNQRYFA